VLARDAALLGLSVSRCSFFCSTVRRLGLAHGVLLEGTIDCVRLRLGMQESCVNS
jgi:hypothetical protein